MSKVLVSEENLTNIANAIREKNGEATTYKPGEMADAIANISGGGSNLKIETQTYTPVEDEITHVFTHNLGVVPDFVNIYLGVTPSLYESSNYSVENVWGYRDGIFGFGNDWYAKQFYSYKISTSSSITGTNYDDSIEAVKTPSLLKNANSESFTFDGSNQNNSHLAAERTYFIIMISGMVEE